MAETKRPVYGPPTASASGTYWQKKVSTGQPTNETGRPANEPAGKKVLPFTEREYKENFEKNLPNWRNKYGYSSTKQEDINRNVQGLPSIKLQKMYDMKDPEDVENFKAGRPSKRVLAERLPDYIKAYEANQEKQAKEAAKEAEKIAKANKTDPEFNAKVARQRNDIYDEAKSIIDTGGSFEEEEWNQLLYKYPEYAATLQERHKIEGRTSKKAKPPEEMTTDQILSGAYSEATATEFKPKLNVPYPVWDLRELQDRVHMEQRQTKENEERAASRAASSQTSNNEAIPAPAQTDRKTFITGEDKRAFEQARDQQREAKRADLDDQKAEDNRISDIIKEAAQPYVKKESLVVENTAKGNGVTGWAGTLNNKEAKQYEYGWAGGVKKKTPTAIELTDKQPVVDKLMEQGMTKPEALASLQKNGYAVSNDEVAEAKYQDERKAVLDQYSQLQGVYPPEEWQADNYKDHQKVVARKEKEYYSTLDKLGDETKREMGYESSGRLGYHSSSSDKINETQEFIAEFEQRLSEKTVDGRQLTGQEIDYTIKKATGYFTSKENKHFYEEKIHPEATAKKAAGEEIDPALENPTYEGYLEAKKKDAFLGLSTADFDTSLKYRASPTAYQAADVGERLGTALLTTVPRVATSLGSDVLGGAETIFGAIDPLYERSQLSRDLAENNAMYASMARTGSNVLDTGLAIVDEVIKMYALSGAGQALAGTGTATSFGAKAMQTVARKTPFVLRSVGSSYTQAINDGASHEDATNYALAAGFISGIIEEMGADNAINGKLAGWTKRLVDGKYAGTAVARALSSPYGQKLLGVLAAGGGEALEEGVEYFSSGLISSMTYMPAWAPDIKELGTNMMMGGICGGLIGGLSSGEGTMSNRTVQEMIDTGDITAESAQQLITFLNAESRMPDAIKADPAKLDAYVAKIPEVEISQDVMQKNYEKLLQADMDLLEVQNTTDSRVKQMEEVFLSAHARVVTDSSISNINKATAAFQAYKAEVRARESAVSATEIKSNTIKAKAEAQISAQEDAIYRAAHEKYGEAYLGEAALQPMPGMVQQTEINVQPQVDGNPQPQAEYRARQETVPQTAEATPGTEAGAKTEVHSPQDVFTRLGEHFGITITSQRYPRALRGGKQGVRDAKGKWHSVEVAPVYGVTTPTGEVLTLVANDTKATAHELGHIFNRRHNFAETHPELVNAMVERLPGDFSYNYAPDKLQSEAVAEFTRLYLNNPADAREFGGTFYDVFEQSFPAADLQELRSASSLLQQWHAADVENKIKSTIAHRGDKEKLSLKSRVSDVMERAEAILFDDMAALRRFDEQGKKAGVISNAAEEAYKVGLLSRRAGLQAGRIVTNDLIDTEGNVIGEGMMQALVNIAPADFDAFDSYLKQKHSIDWNTEGKRVFGDDISPNDVVLNVNKIEAERPEFVEAANKLYDFWDKFMRTWVVETGLVDSDAYEKMHEMYPHYVPMDRKIPSRKGKNKSSGSGAPVKRASKTGSALDTYSAIESLIVKTNAIVQNVKRVEMLRALDGTYQRAKAAGADMGDFMHEIEKDKVPATVDTRSIKDQIAWTVANSLEGNKKAKYKTADDLRSAFDSILDDFVTQFKPQEFSRDSSILTVTGEDGKTRWYQIDDPELMTAISALDSKEIPAWLNALGKVTGTMKSLTTGLNPFFAFQSNLSRDLFEGLSWTDTTANPVKYLFDYVRAGKDVAVSGKAESEKLEAFKNMGGGSGYTLTEQRDIVKGLLQELGLKKNNIFSWSKTKLENLNDVIESASRLAEFGRGDLSTYAGRIDALLASEELTTNFTKHGSAARSLGKIIPFYNAGMQGLNKLVRAAAPGSGMTPKQRVSVFAKSIAYLLLPTLLQEFTLKDDEGYQRIPQRIKDAYFLIKMDNGEFYRIPKPKGPLTFMTSGFPLRVLNAAEGKEDATDDFVTAIWDAISPASGFIFSPIVDVLANKSWSGQPIESAAIQQYPVKYRYDDTTSIIGKAIGTPGIISPKQADYLVKQYGGFVADLLLPATQGKIGSADDVGTALWETIKRRNIIDPAYSNNVESKFYDTITRYKQDLEMIKDRPQDLNKSKEELKSDEKRLAALVGGKGLYGKDGLFTKASKDVSDINKKIKAIEKNEKLSRQERDDQIRALRLLRLGIEEETMKKAKEKGLIK